MPSTSERLCQSLRARLLLAYLCAWLITALLFVGIGSWALRSNGKWSNHGAERAAEMLRKHVRFSSDGQPMMAELPANMQWVFISSPVDAGYRIITPQGRTLLWSSAATRLTWENGSLGQLPIAEQRRIEFNGVPVQTSVIPLLAPDGRQLWLQVAVSERLAAMRHEEVGHAFELTLILAATTSVLLLGLVMFLVLRRLLAPIEQISREAEDIEPRGPWRRLGTGKLPSEIRPLVTSFNQALDRLEEGFERQQRFLGDAAHELKTPLALLRAHVEMGDDATALLLDIDHMSRQVQQLLMLAEVSEPRSYVQEPIKAVTVVNDVIAFLSPLASQHEICLAAGGSMDHPIQGDRSALFVLLKNLVENAINAAPAGSSILLSMNNGEISVRDWGPGIPPEYQSRLFERFWRVPGSRYGGAGLGLSICQEIALAHGWQLAVRNANPGAEFILGFAIGRSVHLS